MIIYSIFAILIRLLLAFQLFSTGKKALKPHTRNLESIFALIASVTLFLGFYVYLVTLLLLVYFGVKTWERKKEGKKIGFGLVLLILTLILFLGGPGAFSVTKF